MAKHFFNQMLERGKLNSGEQLDYAFGLVVGKYKGLPTVDHGGADAGYRSDLIRFPDQHFSAAVLCNSAETNPSALARQVADIVLAKDLKPTEATPTKEPTKSVVATLTAEQMAAIAGLYWNKEEDDFEKVQVKDGKLQVQLGSEFRTLKPAGEAHFHVADVPWGDDVDIHFVPAAEKPKRLEQSFGGGKPNIFESVTAYTPTATELAEYAGAYVSEEIDPIYRCRSRRRQFESHAAEEQTRYPSADGARRFYRGNRHGALHARREPAYFRLYSKRWTHSELPLLKKAKLSFPASYTAVNREPSAAT